ncbi:hypothetical protein QBC37DRAFT_407967 [Rhypophila decipiens]|uniref:Uncharacterized protein n=1 Tax=Rhypophila decipiens TaxID=261697 RepID=A0AAN7BDN4_9PEZI|nr:hypothetical protein QBC37DRAFT_407967 [Rhypophila decipiens]
MTLHTSHCRRVLHRQLLPPGDSIWISDNLLTAAFERYCRVSKLAHRNVGHIPGPLEGQRRLGRRRMGDLGLQYATSAPSWAFPVPLNLSDWQWEPPKPARELEKRPKARIGTQIMQWLETLAYPELNDPNEIVLDPTSSFVAQGTASLRAELDAFLSAPMTEPLSALEGAARAFMAEFEEALRLGSIPPDSVLPIFQEAWQGLEKIYVGRSQGHQLYVDLCSVLMTGISECRVFDPRHFHAGFWRSVVAKMTQIKYEDRLCHPVNQVMVQMSKLAFGPAVSAIWLQIMNHIPVEATPAVHNGVLRMLDAAFQKWNTCPDDNCIAETYMSILLDPSLETGEAKLRDVWERACTRVRERENNKNTKLLRPLGKLSHDVKVGIIEIRNIALAMRHVNPEIHAELLDRAWEQLSRSDTTSGILKYNWLCVLAQIPGVSSNYLFESIARLAVGQEGVHTFSQRQISALLLLQWRSRGYLHDLTEQVCTTYDRWYSQTRGDSALMCLAMAVWWRTPYEYSWGLLSSLGLVLKKINGMDRLLKSIQTVILMPPKQRPNVPLEFLERVAGAVKDHRTAIKLHHLYMNNRRRHDRAWYPAVFKPYVSAIIQDGTIPAGKLWEVLGMKMYQKPPRSGEEMWVLIHQHLGKHGEKRAEIVEQAVAEYASAPHLKNRVAFRHVAQCIRYLERRLDVLPEGAAKALYDIVTRDLHEGEKGRLDRLKWLVTVIRRNYGDEVAERSRVALIRFREEVKTCKKYKAIQAQMESAMKDELARAEIWDGEEEEVMKKLNSEQKKKKEKQTVVRGESAGTMSSNDPIEKALTAAFKGR